MLTFFPVGPDGKGQYGIAYSCPGNQQATMSAEGFTNDSAVKECTRLNEIQVAGKRAQLLSHANRIVKDL